MNAPSSSPGEPSLPRPRFVFAFGGGAGEGDPARVDLLGGKGASLAAMSRAGFPVPPGFTISAECCAEVERRNGAWPDGLEDEVRAALRRLERATARTFGVGPRPLLVAVRSGAGVSMPGMMDTILNCGLNPGLLPDETSDAAAPAAAGGIGWSDYAEHLRMFAASVAGLKLKAEGDASLSHREQVQEGIAEYERTTGRRFPTDPWQSLVECINAVFASWRSERAVTYRRHHRVEGLPGTAVNVQSMFPSERSGVLFTRNPQNPVADEMVLEASWGLGEAVVSGAVTPDIYLVDRERFTLLSVVPGHRPEGVPALSESQVREIAQLGLQVERHFQTPSDIEWGIADGQAALLQTRAIRGLDVLQAAEEVRRSEAARLSALAGGRRRIWVTHNLAETLPHPTPLTWDIIRWFMSGDGGFGRLYRRLGFSPSREVCEHGFLELIAGRIYVDPDRAAGLFWGGLPFEYDTEAIVADRGALEQPPTRMNLEQADPFLFLKLPGLVWSMWRSSRTMRRLRTRREAPATEALASAAPPRVRFETQAQPELERFLQRAAEQPLASMSISGLLDALDRRIEFVLGDFAAESLLPGFFGGVARTELTRWLTQLLGPRDGEELTSTLTSGLDDDITVEQTVRLFEFAQPTEALGALQETEAARQRFFARFGHRAAEEMELSQPRWREDPSFVDRMLMGMRSPQAASPTERHERQKSQRLAAERSFPERLADAGGSSLEERIVSLLREAQSLLPFRELGKFHLMRGYETIRSVLTELARRTGFKDDLFFLRRHELRELERQPDELRRTAQARRRAWQAEKKLTLGDLIDSRELEEFGKPRRRKGADSETCFAARPIASGTAKGPARIIHSPWEAELHSGDILVCPSTDPGWTPLFVHCAGLIVERGGILSHGAIVARDFGIPAVVLENATQILRSGMMLELDAHHGQVTILR